MIIIPVKDGESIDRALKKFKKKFNMTGKMKQLRARREFTKSQLNYVIKRLKLHIKKLYREKKTNSLLFIIRDYLNFDTIFSIFVQNVVSLLYVFNQNYLDYLLT